MKILMIAPQPFFEPRGTPFSVLGRLRALSHLGHQVDLLTYHVGRDVAIPGVTIHRTSALPFIHDVPIGPSQVKLLLDLLLFSKAYGMLRRGHYHLLHTHEEASFFGVLLAKWFRLPHLYDMHSSLPQQLENFRYSRFRPLIGLFSRLERWVINTSDALITICPALAAHVEDLNKKIPHMMIENVASEGNSEDCSDDEMAACELTRAWCKGRKIVLYTGTFEPYQGIDLLIDGAEQVVCQRQDVGFMLVGGKPEQVRHYRKQVEGRGLASHFWLPGTLPMHDMPRFVGMAHVLVSPRTSGTNTPLKIYGYLQSGKPIVATNLPTHTQVLSPDIAVLVDSKPEALAQGILSALEDTPAIRNLGQRARKLFDDRYSFQTFVRKTDQVLQMAVR